MFHQGWGARTSEYLFSSCSRIFFLVESICYPAMLAEGFWSGWSQRIVLWKSWKLEPSQGAQANPRVHVDSLMHIIGLARPMIYPHNLLHLPLSYEIMIRLSWVWGLLHYMIFVWGAIQTTNHPQHLWYSNARIVAPKDGVRSWCMGW